MKKYLILLTIIALQSCSNMTKEGYYKGYETPAYNVEKTFENIEIRSYQPYLVAEVEVNGAREEAVKKGFRILAGYIFGKNTKSEKLAMTSPVAQKPNSESIAMTSPVKQIAKDSENQKWLVQFMMPNKYSIESLPKAVDERIKFKKIVAKKIVAIRFSGTWNDQTFVKQKEILQKFIKDHSLKTNPEPAISYYDDPFTFPWNRRNEIMFEIK